MSRESTVILFVATILFALVTVRNVYATAAVVVTPPNVIQGNNFQVSGTGFPASNAFGGADVYAIQCALFQFVVERNHEWRYALPAVGYYLTSQNVGKVHD